jgi:hypothetical protein
MTNYARLSFLDMDADHNASMQSAFANILHIGVLEYHSYCLFLIKSA